MTPGGDPAARDPSGGPIVTGGTVAAVGGVVAEATSVPVGFELDRPAAVAVLAGENGVAADVAGGGGSVMRLPSCGKVSEPVLGDGAAEPSGNAAPAAARL
jgi:hypothetical protein